MDTNQIPPKPYHEFSPFGKHGMEFHLSPNDYDPAETEARREIMHAYFNYMVPGVQQRVYDELRQKAVDMVRDSSRIDCSAYKTSFLEYMVDLVFWNMWFKRFAWPGHTIPQWPWSEYCRLTGSGSDDPAMAYEELLMVRVMLERVNADSDSDSYTVRSGTDNTSTAGTVFSGTRTANTVSSRARTANTVSSRTITAGTVSSGTRTAGTVFSGTRAANTVSSGTRTAGTVFSGTRTAGTVSSGTRTAGTVFSGTRTANTVSGTRTVNTVTTYPTSTQNANAVPYNTRPETFSFTFAAEGKNAFVGIAQHMAGPSHSRSVELSMRYTSGEIPPGRDLVRRNPSRRNPSRNLSGPWVFPDIYKNDDVGWRNLDSDIYEDDLDVGWRTRD
ncbi:hypothetical protein BGZ61DRAFT_527652 [Ilyonectria robusta]|uniref:uncharacterized protein n=1 Tax=Ilyonectria robusta TaxID=1079257 RepID=UPI001E8DD983|nr:uncharacterized protein BGZ61DRAFT_527652 [Ilyonectria robusta]KAH8734295.1 hypothetical protein BGZ61DRAFT_527652 [Ilyonectria robusta]